jgi:hypothetical protein
MFSNILFTTVSIILASLFPTVILHKMFMAHRVLKNKYKSNYEAISFKDKFLKLYTNLHLIIRIFIGIFTGISIYKIIFVIINMF